MSDRVTNRDYVKIIISVATFRTPYLIFILESVHYHLFLLIYTVAAQENLTVVIAHPSQDVELLCTVTVTSGQTAAWLINMTMRPYRISAIHDGILPGYTANLSSNNLIVKNITMNDDRNGSDYRCVIVPLTGTPSLVEKSNPTILYVAGKLCA